jgi:hypothetical protein
MKIDRKMTDGSRCRKSFSWKELRPKVLQAACRLLLALFKPLDRQLIVSDRGR